ncbi:MAG: hypothetical protein ACSHXI_06945 [Hoeflea sp.]|uniref:hypothetical protein n=1 Tax=Hoeflea sp. TaxID=1940281 RepID=UPI003EF6D86A
MSILRSLETVFNDDGTVRSARCHYVTVNADGVDTPMGTLRETDAIARLPEQASTLALLAAAQAERDAALEGIDAAVAPKNEEIESLKAQIATLTPAEPATSIHKAYFRAALASMGRLAEVDDFMTTQSPLKQELWGGATTIDITDPDIVAVADSLAVDLPATLARANEIKAGNRGAA